jgi:hypothetical protein
MFNRIIGIVGPSGSGKSYTAARIMAAQERAAVYQLVSNDAAYLGCADDIFDGNLKRMALAMIQPRFRYIYRVPDGSGVVEGNKIYFPDFSTFVKMCFTRQHMMMLIDEAHFLCSPRFIPVDFWQSVVTGRHQYLDIVFITQRFSMVHHDLTNNASKLYMWNTHEVADLDGIAKRCGQDVADRVRGLRKTVDDRRSGGKLIPGEVLEWEP